MINIIPDFLTRYFPLGEDPFVSLNDFPLDKANKIKNEHCIKNNIGDFYATDEYLIHRLEIEKWIYNQLLLKGGNPGNNVPIYMCLGESPKSKYDVRGDIQKNSMEIKIPLSFLDLNTITFTYPDSMYHFIVDENNRIIGGERTNTPKVYLYNELETILCKYKDGNEKMEDHYIEAQVWNREQLYKYLNEYKK
jgi:hypothetical protein